MEVRGFQDIFPTKIHPFLLWELMADAHAGRPDIIPEDMQDVPVKETDG